MKYAKLNNTGNRYEFAKLSGGKRRNIVTFDTTKRSAQYSSGATEWIFHSKTYPKKFRVAFFCDDKRDTEYEIGFLHLTNTIVKTYLSVSTFQKKMEI